MINVTSAWTTNSFTKAEDCVKAFTEYLYDVLSPHVAKMKPAPVIRVFAHNFGRYDGRFILQDIFTKDIDKSEIIAQGMKDSQV